MKGFQDRAPEGLRSGIYCRAELPRVRVGVAGEFDSPAVVFSLQHSTADQSFGLHRLYLAQQDLDSPFSLVAIRGEDEQAITGDDEPLFPEISVG